MIISTELLLLCLCIALVLFLFKSFIMKILNKLYHIIGFDYLARNLNAEGSVPLKKEELDHNPLYDINTDIRSLGVTETSISPIYDANVK